MNYHPITRRESIKKILKISGGLALTGVITWPFQKTISAQARSTNKKFIIEGMGQSHKYSVKVSVRKVFEAAGGIQKFIVKQDVVVIKPNISWARQPYLAATTNPEGLPHKCYQPYAYRSRNGRVLDPESHYEPRVL